MLYFFGNTGHALASDFILQLPDDCGGHPVTLCAIGRAEGGTSGKTEVMIPSNHLISLWRRMDKPENDRSAGFSYFCRIHFRTIVSFAFLIAVVCELGGIWHEIRQMRNEQVKNTAYALPEERRRSLPDGKEGLRARRLSTAPFKLMATSNSMSRWRWRLSRSRVRKRCVTAMPLLLILLVGCESAEHKLKLQREQQAIRTGRQVDDLRSRYNAVADWPRQLEGKSFSIDVETVFVRTDQRPILFYADLEDVRARMALLSYSFALRLLNKSRDYS